MRWRRLPKGQGQVEDRRGRPGGVGGVPIPRGRVGGGLGIVALILVLAVSCLGGQSFLESGGGGGFDGFGLEPLPTAPEAGSNEAVDGPTDAGGDFVARISADVQRLWTQEFRRAGLEYQPTRIVLFSRATRGGCGAASAATGPFYCTLDRRIYVDLGFFDQLARRFGAPGDFAQAYVIAHEYGHHVQNLLGISRRVREASTRSNRNELSIRAELQADCFAGVWGHSAFQQELLEPGDVEEGLGAAEAVGDDRIQATTTGRINPESWTHGSAEQRRSWFLRGFQSGDPNSCDTFSEDI
jgi:predicted metalloprotease